MFSVNFTAVVVFISFWVYLLLVKALFFDRIADLHARRQAQMDADRQASDKALMRYFELDATLQAQLSTAQQQGLTLITQARRQAVEAAAQAAAQARQRQVEQLAQVRQQLTQQRQQVVPQLTAQAHGLADWLTDRLLVLTDGPPLQQTPATPMA